MNTQHKVGAGERGKGERKRGEVVLLKNFLKKERKWFSKEGDTSRVRS